MESNFLFTLGAVLNDVIKNPTGGGYLQKMTLGDRGRREGGGVLPKGDIINEQWDYSGSSLQTSGNVI